MANWLDKYSEETPKAQNGRIAVPKGRSSEIKEHNAREEYTLPTSMRQIKDTPEEIAKARKQKIQASIESRKVPYTKDNWRKQLATETGAIGDKMRVSDTPNFFDDYVNPAVWVGSMASSLGQAPYQAQQSDSNIPYLTAIGAPLVGGALGGIGAKSTGQFINNMVNPLAGVTMPTTPKYRLITDGNLTLPSFKNMMNDVTDVSKNNNIYKDIAHSNRREFDNLLKDIKDGEGWKIGPDDLEKSAIKVQEGDADYWNYINAHRAEFADKHFKLTNPDDILNLGLNGSYNKRFLHNVGDENVYYRGQEPDAWDLERLANEPSGDAWSLTNESPGKNTQYFIDADDYKHDARVRTEEDAIRMGQKEAGDVFQKNMINYKGKFDPILKNQNGGEISIAQGGTWLDKWKEDHPSVRSMQNNTMNTKLNERNPKGKETNVVVKDNTSTKKIDTRQESARAQNERAMRESRQEAIRQNVQENMEEAYKHPLMQPGYFTPEGALIGAMQGATNMGPDLYNGEGTKAVIDALMMLPLAPNAIKAAGPAVQHMGKLMGKVGKVDNFTLPAPPSEFHLDITQPTSQIDDLRRAYHNSERFLTLDESALLSRDGYGNRLDYFPQHIRDVFSLDKPSADKMRMVTQYLNKPRLQYNEITDLPLSKLERLNELNAGVRSRYNANGQIAPELYNEQILRNIDDTFRDYNRLNPETRLNPKVTSRQLEILGMRPDAINLRRDYNRLYPETPTNMSGYTKEQTIAMLPKDKADKITKLSPDEFDNIYVTPKGDIVPLATTYNKPVIESVHNDEWVEAFNSNLPRLNKIIEANNTSGKPYTISNVDKSGNIKFDSEFGSSYFNTNITPGKFTGEIEDIANYQYMREIPGISMANTSSGVFGRGGIHKGTKAYESINTYLKEMELGRVKAGFNSQTQYSRPLWENAVKADKAVGYYGRPGAVHAVMKTVVPGAIGLGAAEQIIDKKQNGGIVRGDQDGYRNPKNRGKVVEIQGDTMGTDGYGDTPLYVIPDVGAPRVIYGNTGNHKFPGASKFTEYPMAQNGKQISGGLGVEDWWNNREEIQSTYKMANDVDPFMKNWMNNPVTKYKLNNQIGHLMEGKNPVDVINKNLNSLPIYDQKKMPNKNTSDFISNYKLQHPSESEVPYGDLELYFNHLREKSGVAGKYVKGIHSVSMKDINDKGTRAHEMTHGSGIQNEMEHYIDLNYNQKPDPNYPEDSYERRDYDYLKKDGVYPRIMDIRSELNLKPGQKVDRRIFNGNNMKTSGSIEDLRHFYDDDEIINILNTVASTNSTKKQVVAKNGKELKKLDQLTNFTNYNTPQPSGWLTKYMKS